MTHPRDELAEREAAWDAAEDHEDPEHDRCEFCGRFPGYARACKHCGLIRQPVELCESCGSAGPLSHVIGGMAGWSLWCEACREEARFAQPDEEPW